MSDGEKAYCNHFNVPFKVVQLDHTSQLNLLPKNPLTATAGTECNIVASSHVDALLVNITEYLFI